MNTKNTSLKTILATTTLALGFGMAAQSAVIIETAFPSNGNGGFELDGAGNFHNAGNESNNSINWSTGDTTSLDATYVVTEVYAVNNSASDGQFSAMLNEDTGRGLIQNTGFDLNANYNFFLSFDWLDAANWGATDEVEVRLFTSSDDTITGTLTPLYTAAFTDPIIDGAYNTESVSGFLSGNIGSSRDLFISFTADGNSIFDFARVDQVNLELVVAAPEPSSMALMLIGALGLFKRRRLLK